MVFLESSKLVFSLHWPLCMHAKSLQSCPTLCDPLDWSLPVSSVLYRWAAREVPLFSTSSQLLLLFSHSVVSDSLWHYGLQHARLPCPSLSSRVCSNLCQLSQWCHSSNMWCLSEARHSDSCAAIPTCVFDLHFPDD